MLNKKREEGRVEASGSPACVTGTTEQYSADYHVFFMFKSVFELVIFV